jgi:hypothetical protein
VVGGNGGNLCNQYPGTGSGGANQADTDLVVSNGQVTYANTQRYCHGAFAAFLSVYDNSGNFPATTWAITFSTAGAQPLVYTVNVPVPSAGINDIIQC